MKRIILVGASYPDTLKLIFAINSVEPTWQVIGYLDDLQRGPEPKFMGYPILGPLASAGQYLDESTWFVNNVFADMAARHSVTRALEREGVRQWATLAHPSIDLALVELGPGCVLMPGALIGANARIGSQCAIRMNAIVNHDCVLDDHVFVGPGVIFCGHVQVGRGAYIGAGATIRERVRIGEWSTIGMGAVVIDDTAENQAVVGFPARAAKAASSASL